MVKFTRILAPAAIARILEADPNRIFLIFREDRNLGYWINTKNTDVDTYQVLNNELVLSNKRDGVDCTQEYFAFLGAAGAVIQIVEDFKTPEKTIQPQEEAPEMIEVMDGIPLKVDRKERKFLGIWRY